MQDNIDSIGYRTVCTNTCRSLQICMSEKFKKIILHTDMKLQENQSHKYAKYPNTVNSGRALERSFQLVVYRKAVNLNVVQESHRTKECEPC